MYLYRAGSDMAKFFISVDIDNYHNAFQICIYFRFLPLSEISRNQTVNCGFKGTVHPKKSCH